MKHHQNQEELALSGHIWRGGLVAGFQISFSISTREEQGQTE
jgi:hypothetical protein